MEKKIIGALLFVFCIFWVIGCSSPRSSPSSQTLSAAPATSATSAAPTAQNPSTTTTLSTETNQDKSTPNLSPSSLNEAQAVPILYYHSVSQETGNELRMPPIQFEAQMAYMQAKGYQSVSLEQLYQALYKGGTLPAKPFVITFDDGYVDNYTTAFPILTKHGFTASIFMVTSYINGAGFLSWPQLKELATKGWEIEGHTTNHLYLTKVNSSTLLSELSLSKDLLEKELGQPVNFFAYPFGDLNAKVVQAVKDTGYLMAVTTERGWADEKVDAWHVHRVYCYASMGMNEFSRRIQNPNY